MKLRQYAEGNFLPIIQHEIVEIVVPKESSLTRLQFPDIQNLRDSNLVAIEFYMGVWRENSGENPPDPQTTIADNDLQSELIAKTPTGRYLAPQQVCKNTYLTLQAYNGVEFLHQSPILTHRYIGFSQPTSVKANFASEVYQHQFSGQKCNWPKCYIERFDTYKGNNAIAYEFSFLFSIYYYKTNEINTLMGAEFRKQS